MRSLQHSHEIKPFVITHYVEIAEENLHKLPLFISDYRTLISYVYWSHVSQSACFCVIYEVSWPWLCLRLSKRYYSRCATSGCLLVDF